jgi:hypothetical protein
MELELRLRAWNFYMEEVGKRILRRIDETFDRIQRGPIPRRHVLVEGRVRLRVEPEAVLKMLDRLPPD